MNSQARIIQGLQQPRPLPRAIIGDLGLKLPGLQKIVINKDTPVVKTGDSSISIKNLPMVTPRMQTIDRQIESPFRPDKLQS